MKILILADSPGWIVDRITDVMIANIPHQFTKRYYERINGSDLVRLGNEHDLVHCQNVIVPTSIPYLQFLRSPLLMSVRSHRYNRDHMISARSFIGKIHVVNPYLLEDFPDGHYIPDGIFDQFRPQRQFTVGFAGHPDDYKGFHLIQQACEEAGVNFKPAINIKPEDMLEYYKSIDLYVCASINEGHSTPVMECLAMNIPVVTTHVGIPRMLNVYKTERTVEGIKSGIERYNSWSQIKDYTWDIVCRQFNDLYIGMVR